MDFIEFGYEYLVDVPEIDEQHKELVGRLNNAIKHCTGKKKMKKDFIMKPLEAQLIF